MKSFALPPKYISPISLFDLIYSSAKKEAKDDIDQALQYVCIDFYSGLHYPVVSQLASEGNRQSVEFLRKHFNASSKWIAFGYALGGYDKEAFAEFTLLRSFSDRFLILQHIIYGFSLSNRLKEAYGTLELANHPNDQAPLKYLMIQGFSHHVNSGICEELYNSFQDNSKQKKEAILYRASGLARAGHFQEINTLLSTKRLEENYCIVLTFVIKNFARGNFFTAAMDLYTSALSVHKSLLLTAFCQGYCKGGHTLHRKTLLSLARTPGQRFSLMKIMVQAYASSGYKYEAYALVSSEKEAFYQQILIEALSFGFAEGLMMTESDNAFRFLEKEFSSRLYKKLLTNYTTQHRLDKVSSLLAAADYAEGNVETILTELAKTSLFLRLDSTINTLYHFNETSQEELKRCLGKMLTHETLSFPTEFKDYPAALADQPLKTIFTNIDKAIPIVGKVKAIMNFRQLSYQASLISLRPEIRFWLLMEGMFIRHKHIPASCFTYIATFLSPLSHFESHTLSLKLFSHFRPHYKSPKEEKLKQALTPYFTPKNSF